MQKTKLQWYYENTSKYTEGMGYKCSVQKCKSLLSVKMGSKFLGITIDLKKILRCFYCWVYSFTNYQAISICEISKPSYIKVKEIIMEVLGDKNEEIEKIGGIGMRFQVDESAICNGLVIINPSNHLNNQPNIQWNIGGVVEGDCKKIFFELVPNRKS